MSGSLFIVLSSFVDRRLCAARSRSERFRSDAGQTTAEYALVLLGVAAIAMLVLAWAGETTRIGGLFDAVLDSITGLVP